MMPAGGQFDKLPRRDDQAGLAEKRRAIAGIEELAIALKSPPHLVQAWLRGHAAMPDRKLLLLVDFLERFGRPEKG